MSTLLVLGTLDADWLRTIEEAAARSSFLLHFSESGEAPPAELSADVRAVIVGEVPGGPLRAAERLRQDEGLEKVTIFSPAKSLSSVDYVASLTSGIDDLLIDAADLIGLERRLHAAQEAALAPQRPLRRGLALAIGSLKSRSVAWARALSSAGFRAAVDGESEAPWLRQPPLALVVWEPTDSTHALRQVREARQAGVLCRFVLCVPEARAPALGRECEQLEGVRVLPETSPPDSVVFLVNEMAESTVQNQRASPRRLSSTLVRFEQGGRSDVGLSYNVSAGGLYVRTLAPPASGRVSLSVDVGDARAELSCEVAWSRALSYDGTATAPPGFGVKILEASDSARRLLATLGAG